TGASATRPAAREAPRPAAAPGGGGDWTRASTDAGRGAACGGSAGSCARARARHTLRRHRGRDGRCGCPARPRRTGARSWALALVTRRFPLAMLPTPLMRAERLARSVGRTEIWVKRDDLTGFMLAGKKARPVAGGGGGGGGAGGG